MAILVCAVMAALTMAAPPANAELNDTYYSFFYQSPNPEEVKVGATGGDAQVVVTWSPVTRYTGPLSVRYLVDVQSQGYSSNALIGRGGCTATAPASATGTLSCTIPGLENGRTYYVHLTAAAVEADPYARPIRVGGDMGHPAVVTLCCTAIGPVRDVELMDNGNGRGTISWEAPVDTGGATVLRYDVTVNPGGMTCSTSETSCLVGGLRPNTSYTASATASNRDFSSSPTTSPAVRIPPESPAAPTRVKARLKGPKAVLTWAPPANAAAAGVTRYVVRSTPRGLTCTPQRKTTCTVASLKPGVSYSFEVQATGGAKAGPYSKPSPPVTRPLPPPPPPSPAPTPTPTPKPEAPIS